MSPRFDYLPLIFGYLATHFPMIVRALKPIAITVLLASLFLSLSHANTIDKIREAGTLTIGVANFAPWTFVNNEGELEGFDIDVGAMIAKDLGVTPKFVLLDLESFPEALENGKIDMVAAGLAITPSRALLYDFTIPYFTTSVAIVANRAQVEGVESVEGLNQDPIKIAVVKGTYSAEIAALYIETDYLVTFDTNDLAEQALLDGTVQALFTNLPDATLLTSRRPETLITPFTDSIISSVAGIAVKRGNQDLLNYLNAWIVSRKADTWLNKSTNYWFQTGAWYKDFKPKK